MSAKVYSCPSDIKQPSLDFRNIPNYRKECEEFKQTLKDMLVKRNPNGKNVGEIIRFPAADGYAEYMVAGMKPLELIHISLGDGWDFQYAHLMTAKEVQSKIDGDKAMAKLFPPRKQG
jgi:hypothetical protein